MKQRLYRNSQDLGIVLAIGGLCLLALAAVAFTRGTTSALDAEHSYNQDGRLSYTGPSSDPAAYDSGGVATGEPAFFRLTDVMTYRFDYTLTAAEPVSVQGKGELAVEISENSGWKRTIVLKAATTFSGNATSLTGTLRLADVQALMAAFAEQSGIVRPAFMLWVAPMVEVEGAVGGRPFNGRLAPRAGFRLDESGILPLPRTSPSDPDALVQSQQALVKFKAVSAAKIALPFLDLSVASARVLSLAGLAVVLLGAGVVAWAVRGHDEISGAALSHRFGSLVVPVEAGVATARYAHIVDVTNAADLARIAERETTFIYQEATRPGGATYVVHAMGIAYRWRDARFTVRATPDESAA